MVKINEGGSPGSGSGAGPTSATEAIGVDPSGKPISPEIRKGEEVEEEATAAATVNTALESMTIMTDEDIALINSSPTLIEQINSDKDLEIIYGPTAEGSYYSPDEHKIVISEDYEYMPEEKIQILAHELGHVNQSLKHAHEDKDAYGSKEAFVNDYLDSKGAATLKNFAVRDEIRSNTDGKVDIGIAGNPGNRPLYDSVYEQYKEDTLTRDEAIREIGNVFGDKERPSGTPKGTTYREYYGSFW